MKILKIFCAVMAVHAVAFMLIFANPGCSSTSKPAPVTASAESSKPAVVTMPYAAATGPAEVSPLSPVPAASAPSTITFDPNAPAVAAPVRYSPTRPGTPAASAVQAQPVADVMPATAYTAGKGDSLWTVAKKNHLTVAELAAANNLPASATLKQGQKLIVPGKSTVGAAAMSAGASDTPTYKVKSGESLALIAKQAGTTTAALKNLNGLKSDTVRAGQELKLPAGATMPAEVASTASAPGSAAAKPPGDALTHVVKPGETLGAIARKYQVRQGDIAVANNITNPALVKAGMTLVIPGGWQQPKSAKAAEAAKGAGDTGGTAKPAPGPIEIGPQAPPASDVPVIKVDDSPSASPTK